MITVKCPHCQAGIQGEDRFSGRVVACPTCKKQVQMPGAEQTAVESSVADSIPHPPPLPDAGIAKTVDVESSDVHQRGFQPGDHVAVVLPYALSNIVFIQALPFWPLILFNLILMFDVLLGGKLHHSWLTGSGEFLGVMAFLAFNLAFWVGILCILRWAVWRPAMSGRKVAVYILYILYLPTVIYTLVCVLGLLAPLISLFSIPAHEWNETLAWVGYYAVILVGWGLILLLLVLNLYEKGLREFVKLNGYCPACRHWRFGYIRRPTAVTCSHCGVVIDFIREEP